MTALALDHFVLTGPHGGSAPSDVASLGLVETRRVKHRGHGTANRCYAFENVTRTFPSCWVWSRFFPV